MTARHDHLTDQELERLLHDSRALIDAPEHVIQRGLAVFTASRQSRQRGPGWLGRLAAVLTFDSGTASPLAFGMRSSGGSVRQLLYSVEGRDIDLRIAPAQAAQTFALSGQVLGPDTLGVVVIEPEGGGERIEVVLSELGEFQLPPVAPGTYKLTLELTDMAIDLPMVSIPHAA
jgi:hypothetical protein